MHYYDLDFPSRDQVTEIYEHSVKYLTSKYQNIYTNKPGYIYPKDKKEIEDKVNKMINKTNKNINLILNNISKLKIGNTKKYQISEYHEWKILNNKLSFIPNIEYELINDNKLTRNVVDTIIGSSNSGCCGIKILF